MAITANLSSMWLGSLRHQILPNCRLWRRCILSPIFLHVFVFSIIFHLITSVYAGKVPSPSKRDILFQTNGYTVARFDPTLHDPPLLRSFYKNPPQEPDRFFSPIDMSWMLVGKEQGGKESEEGDQKLSQGVAFLQKSFYLLQSILLRQIQAKRRHPLDFGGSFSIINAKSTLVGTLHLKAPSQCSQRGQLFFDTYLYVLPKYRRQGIGREVLKGLSDYCACHQGKTVQLLCHPFLCAENTKPHPDSTDALSVFCQDNWGAMDAEDVVDSLMDQIDPMQFLPSPLDGHVSLCGLEVADGLGRDLEDFLKERAIVAYKLGGFVMTTHLANLGAIACCRAAGLRPIHKLVQPNLDPSKTAQPSQVPVCAPPNKCSLVEEEKPVLTSKEPSVGGRRQWTSQGGSPLRVAVHDESLSTPHSPADIHPIAGQPMIVWSNSSVVGVNASSLGGLPELLDQGKQGTQCLLENTLAQIYSDLPLEDKTYAQCSGGSSSDSGSVPAVRFMEMGGQIFPGSPIEQEVPEMVAQRRRSDTPSPRHRQANIPPTPAVNAPGSGGYTIPASMVRGCQGLSASTRSQEEEQEESGDSRWHNPIPGAMLSRVRFIERKPGGSGSVGSLPG